MDVRLGGWRFGGRIISEHLFAKDGSNTKGETTPICEEGWQTLNLSQ